jgi:glyceraldehyde 3-phosphate dehydrogenase
MRIAINGFGRIGRTTLRALQNREKIQVVAINDLTQVNTLAHLLKYDTAHGRFPGEITIGEDTITVNGKQIKMLSERDPAKLPWKALAVDVVIESTGRFTDKDAALEHVKAGARKVLVTAPASGGVKTIVHGVNTDVLSNDLVYSTASCTTGAIAPILQILDHEFGVQSGYIVTIHAFTADQNLQDAPHKDLRRARAASYSIIPTTTGAAKAIGDVLPGVFRSLTPQSSIFLLILPRRLLPIS